MAEQRFTAYPVGVALRLRSSAWKVDYVNSQRWLRLSGGVATQSENMAKALDDERWSMIVRIAEALAAEGELSGADIGRLL